MMPEDMSLTVEEVLRRARRDASEAKEARERTAEVLNEERTRFSEIHSESARRIAELEAEVEALHGRLDVLLGPTTADLEARYLSVVAERLVKERGYDAMIAGRRLVAAAVGFPRLLAQARAEFTANPEKFDERLEVEAWMAAETPDDIGPPSPLGSTLDPVWFRKDNLMWIRFIQYGPNFRGTMDVETAGQISRMMFGKIYNNGEPR